MTFSIDTGADSIEKYPLRFGKLDSLGWDILQALPLDPTQSQIDGMVSQVVMGELRSPKMAATTRRKFIALWPMIAQLALTSPEAFDEIILEYADRISTVS